MSLQNWMLFPLCGLTTNTSSLENPLLDQFTILSTDQIEQLNLNGKTLILTPDNLTHSFLAVPLGYDYESSNIYEKAQKSANMYSSLLSILIYMYHYPFSCTIDPITRPAKRRFIINNVLEWRGSGSFPAQQPVYHSKALNYSYSSLQQIIHDDAIKFPSIIIDNSREDSIKKTVSQATLTLANAILTTSPSVRIMQVITCLEILFSQGNSDFKRLGQRLRLIFNEGTIKHLGFDNIIKARNDYVHEGKEANNIGMAEKAIILGIGALILFSRAVSDFSSKDDFIYTIDFVRRVYFHSDVFKPLNYKWRSYFHELKKIPVMKHHIISDQENNYYA